MHKKTKFLLSAPLFILTFCFSAYIFLSASAHRPLTASEFARFSSAIVLNTLLHFEENGGSRTLRLAQESLSTPVFTGVISIRGENYDFPLPKYSMRQEGQRYLTFATLNEWDDYFNRELPAAGWQYVEQVDHTHYFEREGAKMEVIEACYIGTSVQRFTISIHEP